MKSVKSAKEKNWEVRNPKIEVMFGEKKGDANFEA